MWLIPLAHTPSPSAAVRWKGEGTAIDHFFPHTCTHTPHLQRHYRSTCLMFLWGIAGISFCVILHLFPTICRHYNKSQGRNFKNKKWSISQPIIQTISDCSVSAGLQFFFVAVESQEIYKETCLDRRGFLALQMVIHGYSWVYRYLTNSKDPVAEWLASIEHFLDKTFSHSLSWYDY